ncbi:MAG: TolC family protein [Desulfobacterales bacterium]|nr:TolC family protein [Desulfobacterales bacterium]
MKRILICLLYLLIFCLWLVSPAFSQPHYTLRELCRLANENAETIKIAEEDLYRAEQEKERAKSVLIPRATLYGSYLNYKNDDVYSPDVNTLGGKLTQSFTLNGRELIAYDISKKGIEKAGFSKEAVRSEYIFQVAEAYVNTLKTKRLVEVADAETERLTTYRNSVKEKLSVGNVTKTDLYRAEAELSRSLTDQIIAVNDVETAKANIVRLSGIEDEFSVSAADIDSQDGFIITEPEIRSEALKNRYEIKEAKKQIEIATRTVAYEKGDYWPSLDLEGGYNENDIRYGNDQSNADYDTENLYIQAELSFTLYDGGLRKAEVRQAQADLRKAKHALTNQEKLIVLESKTSFLEFETAKNALINLEDEVKSAQENYTAVQMQFKYGMADSIDIMDANKLLVDAERRMSNAEYTYYLAILKIIYTQGDILDRLLADSGE